MRESKEKRRGGEEPRAEGAGSGLGKTGGASSVASHAAPGAEAAKRERMPNRAADLSRQSTTDSGRRRDHVWTGRAARAASDCPVILKLMFVLLLAVSALGEWNKINTVLGGLPKIITAGIILSALVYAISSYGYLTFRICRR